MYCFSVWLQIYEWIVSNAFPEKNWINSNAPLSCLVFSYSLFFKFPDSPIGLIIIILLFFRIAGVFNSPIISLSMGRRVSSVKMRGGFLSSIPLIRAIPEERLSEPITIFFKHKQGPNATLTTGANAVCVLWVIQPLTFFWENFETNTAK